MATKKVTPVKTPASEPTVAELNESILLLKDSMDQMTSYLHSMDWKLWMMMNMVKLIGEENGYSFSTLDRSNNGKISKEYGDDV